jgi:hypothetical protein
MQSTTCPHCGRALPSRLAIPNGSQVRCRSCGSTFVYPSAAESPVGVISDAVFIALADPNRNVPALAPPPTSRQTNQVPKLVGWRGHPVEASALALGIIAVLTSCIPWVCLLSLATGLVGMFIGATGMLYSVAARRSKLRMAGAGFVFSLGSVCLAGMTIGAMFSADRNKSDIASERAHPPSKAAAPRSVLPEGQTAERIVVTPLAPAIVPPKIETKEETLDKIEKSFAKLNVARSQRELIFRTLCTQRQRAEWDADLRYSREREPKEFGRRLKSRLDEYTGDVCRQYGIGKEQVELIELEAKLRGRPNLVTPTPAVVSNERIEKTDPVATKADQSLTASGPSLTKRKDLHRELCLADMRAIWEADRLYPLPDRWREHGDYVEKMTDKYERAIFESYGVPLDLRHVMTAEAAVGQWPQPGRESLDLKQLARGLNITLYAVRGEYTYHRAGCSFLSDGKPIVSFPLYQAISKQGSKPCPLCTP